VSAARLTAATASMRPARMSGIQAGVIVRLPALPRQPPRRFPSRSRLARLQQEIRSNYKRKRH
jgi:hypothetical protein